MWPLPGAHSMASPWRFSMVLAENRRLPAGGVMSSSWSPGGANLFFYVDGEPPLIRVGNGAYHLLGAEIRGALFVGLVFLGGHVPA